MHFNLVASADCQLQFEYLDANGFWDVFAVTDGTNGFTQNGDISWTFDAAINWAPFLLRDYSQETSAFLEPQFWIRIKRLAETVSTIPIVDGVTINTANRLYLERQSFDEFMDSTQDATSDDNGLVTGLTHLAGQQVYAITNGATVGSSFVDASGNTIIKNANAVCTIGMQYTPLLVPMPLYAPTQEGDSLYAEKYVQDLYIDYVDSLYLQAGFCMSLQTIPNMHMGAYTLGQSVPPQTGVYRNLPTWKLGTQAEIRYHTISARTDDHNRHWIQCGGIIMAGSAGQAAGRCGRCRSRFIHCTRYWHGIRSGYWQLYWWILRPNQKQCRPGKA